MENNFQYEAMLERAKAIARAKAVGQVIPKELPPRRDKQPRSNFDFEAALKWTKENGGQRREGEKFEV